VNAGADPVFGDAGFLAGYAAADEGLVVTYQWAKRMHGF
jgi:hypothetical protein